MELTKYELAWKNFKSAHEKVINKPIRFKSSLTESLAGKNALSFHLGGINDYETSIHKGINETMQKLQSMKDSGTFKGNDKTIVKRYITDINKLLNRLKALDGNNVISGRIASIEQDLYDLEHDYSKFILHGLSFGSKKTKYSNLGQVIDRHLSAWGAMLGIVFEEEVREYIEKDFPKLPEAELMVHNAVVASAKKLSKTMVHDNSNLRAKLQIGKITPDKVELNRALVVSDGSVLTDAVINISNKTTMKLFGSYNASIKHTIASSPTKVTVAHINPLRGAIRLTQLVAGQNESMAWAIYRALGAQDDRPVVRNAMRNIVGFEALFGKGIDQISDFIINDTMYSAKAIYNIIQNNADNKRPLINMTLGKHNITKKTEKGLRPTEDASVKYYLQKLTINDIVFSFNLNRLSKLK